MTGLVVTTLGVLGLSAGGGLAQDPPIAVDEARNVFNEVASAAASDGGRLWGRALDGPILFVDPPTRFVVANQADEDGVLAAMDGVLVGSLPDREVIANTAHTWAGVRWTMVMWPLPENRYDRMRLMMHESFHRVQTALGLPLANPSNAHLDTESGRLWLRLEWRALAEALIRRAGERKSAIEDALIFRAHRRSLFDGGEGESALELNEGIAEYTGYKLSGWPDWILADRAAVRIERDERGTSFVRSFAYASGPAYGILLDATGTAWRGALHATSDLGELLADAFGIALPTDLAGEAARRSYRYGSAAVAAAEASRAEEQSHIIAAQRERFVRGPVLVLPLGEDGQFGFDPRNTVALSGVGTVYSRMTVTAAWGTLEAVGGALLAGGDVRVPAPPTTGGPNVTGDGWTLTLADGWEIIDGPRAGDHTVARVVP